MIKQTRDRIRSARHRANGGRARAPRPHRGARRAVDKRTRAALLGAAVMGLMTLVPLSAAAELSPEIQVDLYLVQTEEYLKEQEYAAAREAMEKLIKLAEEHNLTVPDEFHFKHAQVLNLAGEYAAASEALHRYLESAGQAGARYREALTLLHEVSKADETEKAAAEEARARAAEEARAKAAAARAAQEVARGLKMVVVPAGRYRMGSPDSELDNTNQGPVHWVEIGEPFAVGVYEVTFDEWDACVESGGCGGYRPDDKGWGRGARPVIAVSWEDAQRFVAWLREGTGEPYRLLSEAEWEYVARAGTTTPFHYGRTVSTSQANYNGFHTDGVYRERTVAVGMFPANAFGLHDVHGNVSEWTQDCWNGSYRGAPSDGSAWERGDCSRRVLRGGSWASAFPTKLRSAYRNEDSSGNRYSDVGFRVARTLTS